MQQSNKFGSIGQRQYTPLSLWDNPPQAPSMPTKQYTPAAQPSTSQFKEVYDPWNNNPASYSSLYHNPKEEEKTDEEEKADEDTEQADEEGGDDEAVEDEEAKDDEEEKTEEEQKEDEKEAEKNAAGIYTPPIDHYYLDLFKGKEAELDPWGAPLPIPTYTKKTETSTDSDDSGNSDSNSDSTEDNTEENTDENTEDSTEDAKTDEETSTTEDKEDTV